MARPREKSKFNMFDARLDIISHVLNGITLAMSQILFPIVLISTLKEQPWMVIFALLFTVWTYLTWKLNGSYRVLLKMAKEADKTMSSSYFMDREKIKSYTMSPRFGCSTLITFNKWMDTVNHQLLGTGCLMFSSLWETIEIESWTVCLKNHLRHLERDSRYCLQRVEEKADYLMLYSDEWDNVVIRNDDFQVFYIRPIAPKDEQRERMNVRRNTQSLIRMVTCFGALCLSSFYPETIDIQWLFLLAYFFFVSTQIIKLKRLSDEHDEINDRMKEVHLNLGDALTMYNELIAD